MGHHCSGAGPPRRPAGGQVQRGQQAQALHGHRPPWLPPCRLPGEGGIERPHGSTRVLPRLTLGWDHCRMSPQRGWIHKPGGSCGSASLALSGMAGPWCSHPTGESPPGACRPLKGKHLWNPLDRSVPLPWGSSHMPPQHGGVRGALHQDGHHGQRPVPLPGQRPAPQEQVPGWGAEGVS